MKKKIEIIVLCLLILILAGLCTYKFMKVDKEEPKLKEQVKTNKPIKEYYDKEFNVKLIKTVNSGLDDNYLISPYSIEIALNMVKSGAKGNTFNEIDNLVGNREIPIFDVKNRISVTNGAFIKNKYKNLIESDFYNSLEKFDADLLFDDFIVPDKINNWVNEKTYEMIPKILNKVNPDFVFGLANAVALDVEWENEFECVNTISKKFTKEDGKTINVSMMSNNYNYGGTKYFETEDAKGVIVPYIGYDKNGHNEYEAKGEELTKLEFVGILPNDSVNNYIEALNVDKLNNLDKDVTTTKDATIKLSLPRFSYDFDLSNFMEVLKIMGINDAFDADKADFSGVITKNTATKNDIGNLFIDETIHKTYIDLNEKGTKAAAITYFGFMDNAAYEEQRPIKSIEFNKPFAYMIRDSKTKEVLFFGVVRSPEVWKGRTCEEE